MTAENEEEFGNDPILIYQGDMWLGGKFLNIIFRQNLPRSEKHRISLVENKIAVSYTHLNGVHLFQITCGSPCCFDRVTAFIYHTVGLPTVDFTCADHELPQA